MHWLQKSPLTVSEVPSGVRIDKLFLLPAEEHEAAHPRPLSPLPANSTAKQLWVHPVRPPYVLRVGTPRSGVTCPKRAHVPALRTLLPCTRCQRKRQSPSPLPAVLQSQSRCPRSRSPCRSRCFAPSPGSTGATAAGGREGRLNCRDCSCAFGEGNGSLR